ncbi:MAG: type II secretion system F family protein [Gemmataceae bacterium]
MALFGIFSVDDLLPVVVFFGMVAGVFWLMTLISNRNSKAESRLDRIGRPKSLSDIDTMSDNQKFGGLKEAFSQLGAKIEGQQTDLERNSLKVKLANAGFRSETASAVYQGAKVICLLGGLLMGGGVVLFAGGFSLKVLAYSAVPAILGFYIPSIALWYLRSTRQQEIFLTLPDALDLLVVCVESGLGLDAGMRRVTDEMKGHAKVLCEEFALANLQLQMGRPRREVLHDLGVRTGVDDVRSLAAILIQADRFGASIATALRVQSDAMRTRRRQIAEEKAAKVAVKLIFPLVLFIFPAIFVVLVGPAALQIYKNMLSKTPGG